MEFEHNDEICTLVVQVGAGYRGDGLGKPGWVGRKGDIYRVNGVSFVLLRRAKIIEPTSYKLFGKKYYTGRQVKLKVRKLINGI